ncbi:hypothetical protein NC653_019467 [Populus alba x Populus x berolinensis]|uniref:Uncharacterized protein n=1 Tax=Populus alba x Populus x berolinensis TaxID=444605 RepID=A0AAD6VXA7_9ROSI|nr:hypothetical protein NC653_019467 [Populus alba x Populus x berolinensis]
MFLLIQNWRGNKTGLSYVGFAIPLLAKSYYVSLTLNRSSRPSSEVSSKYTGLQFPVYFLDSTAVDPETCLLMLCFINKTAVLFLYLHSFFVFWLLALLVTFGGRRIK